MGGLGLFVLLLGMLVGVHEAGHLLASLVCRVRVCEIGLGLPPRLARLGTWRGTPITLNLLPLGGFILPAGEFDRAQTDGFAAALPPRRAAILVAGPAANFLLAYGLFTLAFALGAPDRVRIVAVDPGSPAAAAGLRPGDAVRSANGIAVASTDRLHAIIDANLDRTLDLRVERREQELVLQLTPRLGWDPGGRAAGFESTGELVRYPLGAAALRATRPVGELLQVLLGIPGRGASGDPGMRLVGVVGMKRLSDRALANAARLGGTVPGAIRRRLSQPGTGNHQLAPPPRPGWRPADAACAGTDMSATDQRSNRAPAQRSRGILPAGIHGPPGSPRSCRSVALGACGKRAFDLAP